MNMNNYSQIATKFPSHDQSNTSRFIWGNPHYQNVSGNTFTDNILLINRTDLAELDLSLQVLNVLRLIVDDGNQVVNTRQTAIALVCGSLLDSTII